MTRINVKILKETIEYLDEEEFILEEGLFSDIKDKISNKFKEYFSYNEWCREVQKILKERYRITIDELKGIFNADMFKKCYQLGAKPFNFVKVLMQKYVEYMRSIDVSEEDDEPEDEFEYITMTPGSTKLAYESKLNKAIQVLKDNGYAILKEGRYNEYSDIGMDPGYDSESPSGSWKGYVDEIENIPELEKISETYFNSPYFLAEFAVANGLNTYFEGDDNSGYDLISYAEGYYGYQFDELLKPNMSKQLNDFIQTLIECAHDEDLNVDAAKIKENIKEIILTMHKACENTCEDASKQNLEFEG